MKQFMLSIAVASIVLSSCGTKDTPVVNDPNEKGKVSIAVTHKAGASNITLGDTYYTNANGDQYQINVLKYYISNISLITQEGAEVKIPESYYLLDESKPSSKILDIADVPKGNYKQIKFLMGVDSTRNVSGVQSGALDPNNGMFWTWVSGYIFAKLEGSSPQSGNTVDKSLVFHIGGYKTKFSGIKQVVIDFPSSLSVSSAKTAKINMLSDINKWFEGAKLIDFATYYNIMQVNQHNEEIADNYKNSFSITSVE